MVTMTEPGDGVLLGMQIYDPIMEQRLVKDRDAFVHRTRFGRQIGIAASFVVSGSFMSSSSGENRLLRLCPNWACLKLTPPFQYHISVPEGNLERLTLCHAHEWAFTGALSREEWQGLSEGAACL